MHQPARDNAFGLHATDLRACVFDLAFFDFSILEVQDAGDRLEHRRLARPVGTEQGDDLPLVDLEGDVPQGLDGAAIDHLKVVDRQQGFPG